MWEELPKELIFYFMSWPNGRFLSQSNIPDIVNEIETSPKIDVIWRDIFDLDPAKRALFFIYLHGNYHSFNPIIISNILSISGERYF